MNPSRRFSGWRCQSCAQCVPLFYFSFFSVMGWVWEHALISSLCLTCLLNVLAVIVIALLLLLLLLVGSQPSSIIRNVDTCSEGVKKTTSRSRWQPQQIYASQLFAQCHDWALMKRVCCLIHCTRCCFSFLFFFWVKSEVAVGQEA